jgi:hypothetical protein
MIHQDLLDAGKIEELMASFRSMETGNAELAEKPARRSTISKRTPRACATPSFGGRACL